MIKSKPLTQSGISVYSNRVTINDGGYYDDRKGTVYIYFVLTTKMAMNYTMWSLLVTPFKIPSRHTYLEFVYGSYPYVISATEGYLCIYNRGEVAPTLPVGTKLEILGIYNY